MQIKSSIWCAVALGLGVSLPGAVLAKELGVPAVPVGVQVVGKGTPVGVKEAGVSYLRGLGRGAGAGILADENGKALYFFDKDEPSKSNCYDECAKFWPPLAAPADATAFGEWSVVARTDGTSQWAYKGSPLYTFVRDEYVGQTNGEGAAEGAWRVASFSPSVGDQFPPGIHTDEIEDAGGIVLLNHLSRTIYAFSGSVTNDGTICSTPPCSSPWSPVLAPALASKIGDFTTVARQDGTSQWAYQGLPLYTFEGDISQGQVHGFGVDPRWQTALVVRYPTPKGITKHMTLASGLNFATAEGKSLYRQYPYYYSTVGHDERHGYPYRAFFGRSLGGMGCTGQCLEMWTPLEASADDKPVGLWSIITREDGTRQWAYREHALYTYKDDQKPGDLLGVNTWQLSINDPSLGFESLFQKIGMNAEIMSGVVFTGVYP